ncbi:MAG TPA: NAD(P)-dependent oxidoreductase [Actinophytocola sp.]|uniref:NAD(P)-dependent oxidoreductase n=1 Tax=Actinophytocola sp. TaxID=1872138 RepID=UPI002DBA8A6F|nr:NAD(P)-dependent oxidoreductase [Actinophytocola sp.]HEU5472275.1 NAD(P)-dependent oxidoreductase [Actinophytocola sp.]
MPADPVAVVGAGTMGAAMAATLRRAGRDVVLYNRTRDRAERVAAESGASVTGTARAAAGGAQVVIVSLADDAAVRSVYRGPDGLMAGLRPGAIVLETSTIAPGTVRELAPAVAERGAVLLDAPVSGSVALVERGELTFMVGGAPEAIERARPVLDILGRRTFQLGGPGSGATMKLVVNSALHGLNQALAEALVLAEKAGLDRSAAYEVFAASALGAPFVQYKRAAYEHPESAPAAFTLELVAKDLALVAGLAEEVGAVMEQLAANRRVVAAAVDAGLGAADMSALATHLRESR